MALAMDGSDAQRPMPETASVCRRARYCDLRSVIERTWQKVKGVLAHVCPHRPLGATNEKRREARRLDRRAVVSISAGR
jgi:hypothetical protein